MPEYRLTLNGDCSGAISLPQPLADAVAHAILNGSRFEISGAFEKTDGSARLIGFVLSPIPIPSALRSSDIPRPRKH